MSAPLPAPIVWLRDADWLTRDRASAYVKILFFMTVAAALLWIALAEGGVDRAGKPLGTDFVSFWAASQIALSGRPAAVYDIATHQAAQSALFSRDGGEIRFVDSRRRQLYQDRDHLSVAGASLVKPKLIEAMGSLTASR